MYLTFLVIMVFYIPLDYIRQKNREQKTENSNNK